MTVKIKRNDVTINLPMVEQELLTMFVPDPNGTKLHHVTESVDVTLEFNTKVSSIEPSKMVQFCSKTFAKRELQLNYPKSILA